MGLNNCKIELKRGRRLWTVYTTDHVTGSGEVPCDERLKRQPLDGSVFIVAETVVVVGEDVSR